jgi:transposase
LWTAPFPPARLGGEAVEHGYKGKGSTIHIITDGEGSPLGAHVTSAKGDERMQVEKLVETVGDLLSERDVVLLEADKGYDCMDLRLKLLARGIYPLIPYRGKRGQFASWVKRVRWKVERAASWMKRGYRRVATRWERLSEAYAGIVLVALCSFWLKRIVG